MRRTVTLLNQVAVTVDNSAGLQAQMDSAVKVARQHQDDNLKLKQVRINLSLKTELKLVIVLKCVTFILFQKCVISIAGYLQCNLKVHY